MTLRVGFDYHLAEAEKAGLVTARPWVARCTACGWVGPSRGDKTAAQDDALTHDVTENES